MCGIRAVWVGRLQYFLTDHPGSIVGVMDSTGTLTSQQRYLPFGSTGTDVGSITQTDHTYTGQQGNSYIKLMDYKARLFDASIGRFISADSVTSGAGNPQAWNRYAYTLSNPIRYSDPSGHCATNDLICKEILEDVQDEFSVKIDDRNGLFTRTALIAMSRGMGTMRGAVGNDRFSSLFTGVRFSVGEGGVDPNGMGEDSTTDIYLGKKVTNNALYVEHETVHELAHVWNNTCDGCLARGLMAATGGWEEPERKIWFITLRKYEYHPGGQPLSSHGTINPGEDWAESVTAYLYPGYSKIPDTGGRLDFVRKIFSGSQTVPQ